MVGTELEKYWKEHRALAYAVYEMAKSWAPTSDTSNCFDYGSTSYGGYDHTALGVLQQSARVYASHSTEMPISARQLWKWTRTVREVLDGLARLSGGVCREAGALRGELAEQFTVLEATLLLLCDPGATDD